MASEHDVLISEYQKYKNELSEYEKELYLYESRIEEYGKSIVEQISKLQGMGVQIDSLTRLVNEDGEIDLSDEEVIRELINDVYSIYKENIDKGLEILNSRNNGR